MALLGAAVAILAVVLPRLVDTPEFRSALARRAGEALGTPVEWKRLEIGLFPPRVMLEGPRLVEQDVSAASPAHVQADGIDLRLALWPLLERRIEIQSLALRSVALVVTRNADGFVLPEVFATARRGGSSDAETDADADEDARGGLALDVRSVVLEDARVVVRDRAQEPPVDWRLEALALSARGESLGRPLALAGRAQVFADGTSLGALEFTGRVDLAGAYDLDLDLSALPLTALARFVPDVELAAGTLSGRVSVAGGERERIAADLDIAGLVARARGVELAGGLAARIEQRPEGRLGFELDWRPAVGGPARITGERAEDGDLAATAMLDGFALDPFGPLLGEDRRLGGEAKGELSFAVERGAIRAVETDLEIVAARYADARIDATGGLELGLSLGGIEDADALRLQAVFAPTTGGRVDARVTGTLGGAQRAALRFDAFDLAPLAPLLPEKTRVAGRLTGELELETTSEREIASLASRLRVADARVERDAAAVAGDLELDAKTVESGPIELALQAALGEGGAISLAGTSTRSGVVDLGFVLERFDLAALVPFLASPELSLAGRASGKGRIVGPYAALERAELAADLVETAIRRGELEVEGPFGVELAVAKPMAPERSGTLALALDRARLAYGESLRKPAGVRAQLSTRLARDAAGTLVLATKGALHTLSSFDLEMRLGDDTALTLSTPSFDLKGWSTILPALADYAPEGIVGFERFALVQREGARDRFAGRVDLRGLDVTVPSAGRVRLRGALVGGGESVGLADFTAALHGLTLGLEGDVEDPLADARFRIAAHSVGRAEANDFVSGLTAVRDTLFGALRFDAVLAGMAGGEAKLVDTLTGNVRLTIGETGGGRLRGRSLLTATLGQIPLLGGAAQIATRLRAAQSANAGAPDYLADTFEIFEADLAVADGALDAKTMRLRYRGHEARLAGKLVLDGLALDMRGELTLDSSLVAALSGKPAASLADRGPVTISLARITNTLAEPKVSLAPETLAAIPKLLMLGTGAGAIVDEAIDRAVGETVGKVGGAAGDALGGVLGQVGEKIGIGGLGSGGRAPTAAGEASPAAEPAAEAPSQPASEAAPVQATDAPGEPPASDASPADAPEEVLPEAAPQ